MVPQSAGRTGWLQFIVVSLVTGGPTREKLALFDEGASSGSKMEEGDAETSQRFRDVTDLCLKGQLAVLGRLGIDYDDFIRTTEKRHRLGVEVFYKKILDRGDIYQN